jgi:hypothetical protein
MSREDHNPGGGRSQDDLKGKESGISRLNDAQLRFSADLEQLTVVEAVVVADGYTTIGMASSILLKGFDLYQTVLLPLIIRSRKSPNIFAYFLVE